MSLANMVRTSVVCRRTGDNADIYVLNKLKKQLLLDLEEPLYEKGRLGRACAKLLKEQAEARMAEAGDAVCVLVGKRGGLVPGR